MPIESIQNISDPVFASSSEIWRLNSIEEVNSSYAGYDLTVTGSKVEWKYTSEEPGVETQYSNFILPDMPTELIPGQEFIIQLNAETGEWTDDRKWFSSAPKDEWYNSSYYTRMSIEAYFASQEINEDVRAWWLQKNTLVDDEYHTTEYSGENKLKPYSWNIWDPSLDSYINSFIFYVRCESGHYDPDNWISLDAYCVYERRYTYYAEEASDKRLNVEVETNKNAPYLVGENCEFTATVTDKDTGTPVSGADLEIVITHQESGRSYRYTGISDAYGRFSWYKIWEEKDGGTWLVEVTTNKSGYIQDYTTIYVLVQESYITGNVLESLLMVIDPGGEAFVKAFNSTGGFFKSNGIKQPDKPWDEDGSYIIYCPPGVYNVEAWANCYLPQWKEGIDTRENPATGVNFRLSPSLRRLDFLVVDVTGAPVNEALINLTQAKLWTWTNATGQAWLQLTATVLPDATNYNLVISKDNLIVNTWIYNQFPYCASTTDYGTTTLGPFLEKITENNFTQIKVVLEEGVTTSFIVAELKLEPVEVYEGERVTISAEIMNPSSETETYDVDLIINGVTLATKNIEVAPGGTETVSWYTTEEWSQGTYEVVIGDKTGIFRIIEDTDVTISLYMESSVLKVGDSATISGFVSPVLENCKIRIYLRDSGGAWVDLDDVEIDFDGYYLYTWEPFMIGEYQVRTALIDESGSEIVFSDTETLKVEEESMCIIATATYGSELSPEVQFLRNFRDKTVLNTFAGSSFMVLFNLWYYSFSPSVAQVITQSSLLQRLFRVLLTPLLKILQVSKFSYSLLSFNKEIGVFTAGLVASILITIIYLGLPLMLVNKRYNYQIKTKLIERIFSISVLNLFLILSSEIFKWENLMMFSTLSFIISCISLTSIIILKYSVKNNTIYKRVTDS
jgi:peptide/nickel transport system substrate-binding protein